MRPLPLLALLLAGCTAHWSPVPLPAPEQAEWHVAAAKVQVTDSAGVLTVGTSAVLLRDTIWVADAAGSYHGTALHDVAAVQKWTDKRGMLIPIVVTGLVIVVVAVVEIGKAIDPVIQPY